MDHRIHGFPARTPDRAGRSGAFRSLASIVLLGALACVTTATGGAVPTHKAPVSAAPPAADLGNFVQDVHLRTGASGDTSLGVALETDVSLNCVLEWLAYRACVLSGGGGDCVVPQCTPISGSPEAALAQAILDARVAQSASVN